MNAGAAKLVGQFDFRNFCKMDVINVQSYERHVLSSAVSIVG
jgi:tRNA pseudouridine38/39 synthase